MIEIISLVQEVRDNEQHWRLVTTGGIFVTVRSPEPEACRGCPVHALDPFHDEEWQRVCRACSHMGYRMQLKKVEP